MLTSREFRERWRLLDENAVFVKYEPAMFEGIDIPQESAAFLLEAGLPKSAAPFLGMEQPQSNTLPTVADEWRISEIPRRYLWLGADGEGSPICIEEGSGNILLLDHEFRFNVVFMNTNVSHFAAFLLAYGEFVQKMNADDECAGLDGWDDPALPAGPKRELADTLRHIDKAAVEAGNFWRQELVSLGGI